MKLEKFLLSFKQTAKEVSYHIKYQNDGLTMLNTSSEVKDVISELGGGTFDNGLFRIHNVGSFYYWTKTVLEYFKIDGSTYVFAFDWVGRQYAVNQLDGRKLILMIDPATAEYFELEIDIEHFLSDDLNDFKNNVLEARKFESLTGKMFKVLSFDKCVGFKTPLMIGGKDELENLEVIDLEVYWDLNYQIYIKTRNLPNGSPIRLSI